MEKSDNLEPKVIAELLVGDLRSIGDVSCEPRLAGFGILEDGVMFGFVDRDGTPYLRTTTSSAARFHALGSTKHPQMPYWSVPRRAATDLPWLCELAYEAADSAHIDFSFNVDDFDPYPSTTPVKLFLDAVSFTVLAA